MKTFYEKEVNSKMWRLIKATISTGTSLEESLSKAPELNLHKCGINNKSVEQINNFLNNNKNLVSLDLSNNRIYDEEAEAIGDSLRHNENPVALDLSQSIIFDKEAEVISKLLKHNKNLVSLDLSQNNIGDKEAKIISELLRHNENLVRLNLSGTYITKNGDQVISELLKHKNRLKELNLSSNRICDEEAEVISEFLKNNNKLVALDLSYTKISDDGVIAIGQSLTHNNTLKILYLNCDNISNDGLKIFFDLLNQNKSLKDFYFQPKDEYFFAVNKENDKLKIFANFIKHNKSLNTFYCAIEHHKFIDDDEIEVLCQGLEHNNAITAFVPKWPIDPFDKTPINKKFDTIHNLLQKNYRYVKDTAEFLLSKFVNKDKEFSLIKEIKYLKHYQACNKNLLAEYFQKSTNNEDGLAIPTGSIDDYIAKHFLELTLVAKETKLQPFSMPELSGEIFSYLGDASLWQVENGLELSGDDLGFCVEDFFKSIM